MEEAPIRARTLEAVRSVLWYSDDKSGGARGNSDDNDNDNDDSAVHPQCSILTVDPRHCRHNNNNNENNNSKIYSSTIWKDNPEPAMAWVRADLTPQAQSPPPGENVPAAAAAATTTTTTTNDSSSVDIAIDWVHILSPPTCSAVRVQLKSTDVVWRGYLVLLCCSSSSLSSNQETWQCISMAWAPSHHHNDADDNGEKLRSVVRPADLTAVTEMAWDGYCGANRACNGTAMARVFHPTCRLTFATPTSPIIIDAAAFCNMVTTRYTTPRHAPYVHLQWDPRAAAGDTLWGVDFVTPHLALVTLRVGHPPCLWTDFLTCARLEQAEPLSSSAAAAGETSCTTDRWWIVHKSSVSEPWLVDEAQERKP